MEVKKDCNNYDEIKNECKGLDELYCKKENCSFYKNRDKFIQDEINRKRNKF